MAIFQFLPESQTHRAFHKGAGKKKAPAMGAFFVVLLISDNKKPDLEAFTDREDQ
ncbi:MAG: hypothetical protein ACI82A_000522 [Candidatus Azotimanducaceae bacterium]|jgi:hypothetical protein